MTHTGRIAPAPQHLQALERANEVRLARAELKRRIARGDVTAAEVILDAPHEVSSMTIGDLLTSQRRWGTTRSRRVLSAVPLAENKAIGSMTERQRNALASLLREHPTAARSSLAVEAVVAAA